MKLKIQHLLKELTMIPSRKSFLIGLALVFILANVPACIAANFKLGNVEKFIYYADTKPGERESKRMTWEGVLDTDSPERIACKKSCLANYGIDGIGKEGKLCDDKGWNRCLAYMNKSFFPLLYSDGCREDLMTQCKDCWQKHTQICYDKTFASCLDTCYQK